MLRVLIYLWDKVTGYLITKQALTIKLPPQCATFGVLIRHKKYLPSVGMCFCEQNFLLMCKKEEVQVELWNGNWHLNNFMGEGISCEEQAGISGMGIFQMEFRKVSFWKERRKNREKTIVFKMLFHHTSYWKDTLLDNKNKTFLSGFNNLTNKLNYFGPLKEKKNSIDFKPISIYCIFICPQINIFPYICLP